MRIRCMCLFVMKKYVKWLKQEAISWYCLRNETYVLVMRIRCMCLFVMKEYVKWLSGLNKTPRERQEATSWYCLRNETYVLVTRTRCMCLFVMKEYVKWLRQEATSWCCLRNETYVLVTRTCCLLRVLRCLCLLHVFVVCAHCACTLFLQSSLQGNVEVVSERPRFVSFVASMASVKRSVEEARLSMNVAKA